MSLDLRSEDAGHDIPALKKAFRAMAANGAHVGEIARSLGVSASTIRVWASVERIAVVKKTSVRIPKWVPLDLQDEFLDVAANAGEEAAASHIRRLKREMERAVA